MSKQRSPKQLAKFIDYILRRRPDEFGLVTDEEGFIRIKELLKAVNEEEGFRYVRRSHLDEIMLCVPDHAFEMADNRIRSKFRDQLPQHTYAKDPPKLLYTCVRRKAYPHVAEKGIQPPAFSPGRIIIRHRDGRTPGTAHRPVGGAADGSGAAVHRQGRGFFSGR